VQHPGLLFLSTASGRRSSCQDICAITAPSDLRWCALSMPWPASEGLSAVKAARPTSNAARHPDAVPGCRWIARRCVSKGAITLWHVLGWTAGVRTATLLRHASPRPCLASNHPVKRRKAGTGHEGPSRPKVPAARRVADGYRSMASGPYRATSASRRYKPLPEYRRELYARPLGYTTPARSTALRV